jgi:hypothetical protein
MPAQSQRGDGRFTYSHSPVIDKGRALDERTILLEAALFDIVRTVDRKND